MGTTTIAEEPFERVNCETISLNAVVIGDFTKIIDFVIGLNNNYATGYVRSVQAIIGDEIEENSTSVNIQMIVYSQKEADNGK